MGRGAAPSRLEAAAAPAKRCKVMIALQKLAYKVNDAIYFKRFLLPKGDNASMQRDRGDKCGHLPFMLGFIAWWWRAVKMHSS